MEGWVIVGNCGRVGRDRELKIIEVIGIIMGCGELKKLGWSWIRKNKHDLIEKAKVKNKQ
jgi:hypothetical protein